MNVGDQDTCSFFKNSAVKVVLCSRNSGSGYFFDTQMRGLVYSHHQKSVIVDVQAGEKRSLSAFLGGLDLCAGRYDTPQHSLFSTLQTVHKDDYYNPFFNNKKELGCPREPWHDLHCRIDGPAAYDVLHNFEQRWRKVTSEDSLANIDNVIIDTTESASITEDDPDAWDIQIFRSIDSNSVQGFDASIVAKGLVCEKNKIIDKSIHNAYVTKIRAAEHFIYIENQYFIGSSSSWDQHKKTGANNLIPLEISLKIASKIRSKERFAVYIVIPMWPEGSANSFCTPEILAYQHQTMQMMYRIIQLALHETEPDKEYKAQDYLNFFCLGNREPSSEQVNEPEISTSCTVESRVRRSRRFMIYVHSKAMIIDDQYVLLGSANINQRSLDGARDTEIAMGASQPHEQRSNKKEGSRGQIYSYRMSLWKEHTGIYEDAFDQPESIACMRRLREIGDENWERYKSDEVKHMKSHLISYPMRVNEDGSVVAIPGCEKFPDVGYNVNGRYGRFVKYMTKTLIV